MEPVFSHILSFSTTSLRLLVQKFCLFFLTNFCKIQENCFVFHVLLAVCVLFAGNGFGDLFLCFLINMSCKMFGIIILIEMLGKMFEMLCEIYEMLDNNMNFT